MNQRMNLTAGHGKVLVVLADPFSARVFASTGIIDGLRAAFGERLALLMTDTRFDLDAAGAARSNVVYGADVINASPPTFWQRVHGRIDRFLDERIGFYPLAIRFSLKHGFHISRMRPGHNNWFLDSARVGPLPRWEWLYRLMFRWVFSRWRYVETGLRELLADGVDLLVLSNLQYPNMYRYLLAARRAGVPVVGYVASWDHLVGKGVVYRGCQRYLVQNEKMREELAQLHGVAPGRVEVTGWPQSDVLARRYRREQYQALLKSFGLDPDRPCVLITGNTETNAPYEPQFLARLVAWWQESGAHQRFSLVFRPHPKDTWWQKRFASVPQHPGLFIQPPSYTDMDVLALMLQGVDCVVTNAGTILLDSLASDRPVVCVLYDEGASGGERHAANNVIGEHYREVMARDAFIHADSFEAVTAGIERSLRAPAEFAAQRRAVAAAVLGQVDGGAAERVVRAIVAEAGVAGTVRARGAAAR